MRMPRLTCGVHPHRLKGAWNSFALRERHSALSSVCFTHFSSVSSTKHCKVTTCFNVQHSADLNLELADGGRGPYVELACRRGVHQIQPHELLPATSRLRLPLAQVPRRILGLTLTALVAHRM